MSKPRNRRGAGSKSVATRNNLSQAIERTYELLEPRKLLSGTHDPQVLDAITQALLPGTSGGFTSFTNRLKDNAILSKALPLVNRGIGDNIVPKTAFDSLLSRLSGSYASVSALGNALEGSGGIGDGLQVLATRDATDNVEYDLRLVTSSTISVPLSSVFGSLDFAATGSLSMTVNFDFRLTVGGQWSGSSAVFYVADSNDQLKVSASITSTNVAATARLGFLDVNLSNVNASLNPTFNVNLVDPGSAGGTGRVTLSELNSGTIGTLLPTNVTAGAATSFSATLSTSGAVNLPSTTFSGSWSDINDVSTFNSNLGTLGAYSQLADISASTFTSGLSKLVSYIDAADGLSGFGRPLPVLGDQFASILDLPGFLNSRLVTSIGSYNSVETLATKLAAQSGLSGVGFSISGSTLTYTINLSVNRSQSLPLELSLQDLPLRLEGGAVNVTAQANGTLKFGVDLANRDFFLADDAAQPEFSASASINANNINASGGVGFIAAQVSGGQAKLNVAATLDLDKSGSNRFTLSDLSNGAAVASSVHYGLTGNASATLPISSTLLGLGTQTFSFNWTNLNDPGTFSSNISSFSGFSQFENLDSFDAAGGIDALVDLLTSVSGGTNSPFNKKLPLVNKSLADLVDFATLLAPLATNGGVGGTSQNPTTPFNNSDQLLQQLRNIAGIGAGNASYALVGQNLEYTVHMDRTIQRNLPIDLNIDKDVLDLSVSGNATVTLDTDLDIKFGLTPAGQFYVVAGSTPNFSATGSIALNAAAAARLGFIDVTVGSATGTFAANASIKLLDPGTSNPPTPGKITQSEFDFSNLGSMAAVSLTGSASANLPLTTNISGVSGGTLKLNWSNIADLNSLSVDTSGVSLMSDFDNVEPADLLDGLNVIPNLLSLLKGNSFFGKSIGLLGGNLGNIADLAGKFTNALNTFKSSSGNSATAQRVATYLGQALTSATGGAVNITTSINGGDVRFVFTFAESLNNKTIPIGFSTPIGPASFNLGATAGLSGSAAATLTIGMRTGDGIAASDRFYLAPGSASGATIGAKINVTNINAGATLGYFSLGVTNGTANVAGTTGGVLDSAKNATLGLQLVDPNSDGRISMTELTGNPAGVLGPITGDIAANLNLPISSGLPSGQGPAPKVVVTWNNLLSGTPTVTTPDLNNLVGADQFNFSSISQGIQSILSLIQSLAGNSVMQTKIPLIDVKLADVFNYVQDASQFWNQISSSQSTPQAFANAIAAADAAIPFLTITPSSDTNLHNPAQSKFDYTLDLDKTFPIVDQPFKFGGGLFTLSGAVHTGLHLTQHMVWGMNPLDGFFIKEGASLNAQATLSATFNKIGGTFGFLSYGVSNGSGNVSFGASVTATDADADDFIKLDQLKSNLFGLLNFNLGGTGALDLPIGAHLGDGGPGIKTEFRMYWDATDPTAFHFSPADRGATPIKSLSTDPTDGFAPIQFEIGEWISDLIGPYIQKIEEYNPLRPELVDFLNTQLPIIGKTPIELLASQLDDSAADAIETLLKIADIANDVSSFLGSGKALDLSDYFPAADKAGGGNDSGLPAGSGSTDGGIGLISGLAEILRSLRDDYSIQLLALDPDHLGSSITSAAISLFMGKDIDLIRWNPAPFKASFPINTPEFPIAAIAVGPIVGTITGQIHAAVGFFADPDFGFSSRGLRDLDGDGTINFFDGFFIGDNITNLGQSNESDPFEVGGTAEVGLVIKGTVTLLGLIGAGIEGGGGITGTIGLDLSDVKYNNATPAVPTGIVERGDKGGDNHIYFDELEYLFANYPTLCVLHLGGSIGAYVEFGVFITVFGIDIDVFHTRQDFELFNFDIPCDDPPSSNTATVTNGGTTLSVNQSNSHYDYSIRFDYLYDDKQKLTGLRVSRDLHGGQYTHIIDSLIGTGGTATLVDIYGNPLPIGSKAKLSTDGKVYELQLSGTPVWKLAKDNAAADTFQVDSTHDFEDFTYVDPSSPNYIGNVTTLIINGSEGGDTVRINPKLTDAIATIAAGNVPGVAKIRNIIFNGFGGADSIDLTELDSTTSNLIAATLDGGDGDDTLRGSFRPDYITGGAGKDSIDGNRGADTISGGDGNDSIVGGADDDSIDGGADDDMLLATSGRDTLVGSDGNDCLIGGVNDDLLLGGIGNDSIAGGSGFDTVYGGADNDLIDGGEDNDNLNGEAGNDTILGGTQDDLIDGGAGNDSITGDDGYDVVRELTTGDVTLGDSLVTGAGTDSLGSGVERVAIVGSGANERFDVSNWSRGAVAIDGAGGNDTIVSNGREFVLDSSSLMRDGITFALLNVEAVDLTGTDGRVNTFDVTNYGGGGSLTSNGSTDTLTIRGAGNVTLTNALLTRSIGTSLNLAGIERVKYVGGADANNFVASAFTGSVTLLGNDGNDTLVGGSGDDSFDGGAGTDSLLGNGGDDLLLGGGGLTTIDGGSGDDVIRGSNDAADTITGASGRDYILGNGGNDAIDAGANDDTVLGGSGDDTISGQSGKDLLVGGADHDVVYGQNAANSSDDNAVDTIYGDFATNRNTSDNGDTGAPGRDCLYGGGGNDLIFGEGDDDFISGGAGAYNYIDYGSGESTTPSDFVAPTPTPAPSIGSIPVAYDGPTLPLGPVTTQRWGELSGSGGTFGVSGGIGVSTDVSVTSGSSGTYLAWADNRSGNYEIYVAKHNGSAWVTLGTSASGTGVSNTPTVDSRRPNITLDTTGTPVVTWTELTGSGKKINVARWNGTSWVAIGTSLATGGISAATNADNAKIVYRGSTPIVALVNEDGTDQANVLQYNGSTWVAYGSGAATHSAGSDAADIALATDGANVAIAYRLGGDVFVRQSNGGAWSTLGGGAIAANAGNSVTPTLTYGSAGLFAAWSDDTSGHSEIYAAKFNGSSWASVGTNSFSGGGVSNTGGSATRPQLAAVGSSVTLAWLDDQAAARRGDFTAVFAKRFDGTSFVEQVAGDAQRRGIAGKYTDPTGIAIGMTPTGQAVVAWSDRADGREEIKLRINTAPTLGTAYYVNDKLAIADVYTTAPGSDSGNGTGPGTPINNVQKLLDTTSIAAGSVIYLDGGSFDGFTISAPGVRIVGAPGGGTRIKGTITVNAANVVLEQLDVDNVNFGGGGTSGGLFNAWIRGSLSLSNASSTQIAGNRIDGAVTVSGGSNVLIASNERNASSGIAGIQLSGTTGILVRDNVLRGGGAGIQISSASGGTIEANDVGGATTALDVNAAFTGQIRFNRFHDATTGVRYAAGADLSSNLIYANSTGVSSTVVGQTNSLGSVGASDSNFIYRNTIGISLSNGAVRKQNIFGNNTGVSGTGTLGGTVAADANVIELNSTGAAFGGTVQFNRIGLNDVGLKPTSNTLIHHNIFYRNTTAGISASGATGLQIVSNTIYNKTGDAVKLAANSSGAELRNNILWTDGAGGYAINIADDASRTSFFSDFNSLIAGAGAGGIVYFSKAFTDLIDWQRDVNRYDLHSVGSTAVDPTRATPRFTSLGTNDLQLFAPIGGRRESNAGIDAADALTDIGVDRTLSNLLTNPSFESGLTGWTASQNAGVGTTSPWSGSSYFSAGNIAIGFVEQTVPISAAGLTGTQIDTSDYVLVAGGRFRSALEDPNDTGKLTIKFLDGSSNVIGTSTVTPGMATDRWQLDGGRFQIPSGTRSITYRFESTRLSGSTADAFLDSAFMRVEPETAAYDQGAFGQNVADTIDPQSARLYVRYPDMYQDLELGKPITIRWESYGNASERPVRIELLKDTPDGPALLTTLSASTPDDGEFIITPGDFGLNYGDTGLRVQISFVGDPFTLDRSIEASTVPESGSQYYVDDASNANDQYTPTAVGNNRNTGKSASAPKPLLTTLLRTYDLGAGDVVNVDTGSYGHFDNVVLSGNLALGDDEGAVYTGPTTSGKTATIFHYFPTTGTIFEFNDGDFTTIQHFVLQGANRGVWARNDSTALTVSDVTVNNTTLDGIRLESDALDAVLQHVSVTGAGKDGVYSGVRLAEISGGTFSNNGGSGLYLVSGATLLDNNTVQNNAAYGIYVGNGPTGGVISNSLIGGNGQWGIYVGNSGQTTITGNRVTGNTSGGINFYSNSTTNVISGNTVSNHTGFNAIGIYAQYGTDVTGNVATNNTIGIDGGIYGSTSIRNNRVTGSSNAGIRVYNASGQTINGNVLVNDRYGVDAQWGASGGTISNNVIYNSSTAAIHFGGSGAGTVLNNTIYQPAGDGVRIDGSSKNIALRNNVIWTLLGGGIVVASDSQIGFASDYNLLYATGSGSIGTWQGVARTTLAAWRSASFGDNNSISADPKFIDLDGADNTLGNDDDDLHLSTPYGYNAGGWLAPVLNTATGLPVAAPGTLTTNGALPFSPGIDRGDPSSSYANEPVPNGSVINLGAYGNTTQSERSPGQYMLVTSPNGGETWSANQSFNIRWNSHNFSGTVNIVLIRDSQPGFQQTIASGVANSGTYGWTVPTSITPGTDYRIRIVRNDVAVSDVSDGTFELTGPINVYYVNDNSQLGDVFTSAIGNDANTGTSPNAPKASIAAVLAAYDLGPGDIIRVDTGRYGLTSNIVIGAQDAGVTIEGPSGVIDAAAQYNSIVAADAPTANSPMAGPGGAAGAFEGSPNQSSGYNGSASNSLGGLPSGTTSFSLELWFKPTTNAGQQYLLGSAYTDGRGTVATNDDYQQRYMNLYTSGGAIYFDSLIHKINSSTGKYDLSTISTGGAAFRVNEWNHVVVTFDGNATNAAKMYLNGTLATQSGAVPTGYNEVGTSSTAGALRTVFGADVNDPAASANFFNGNLQAHSAYAQPLSADRVHQHFEAGFGGQRRAVLDRQNTNSGSYVFDLQNADDVTLRQLQIIGAYTGIYASSSSDSDHVTLQGLSVMENSSTGIDFETGNEYATIAGSEFAGILAGNNSSDNQNYHVYVLSSDALISDNRMRGGSSYAVWVAAPRTTVKQNRILGGDGTGIYANYSSTALNAANALLVTQNEISGMTGTGINTGYYVRVEQNQVHDLRSTQAGITATGMRFDILGNTIWSNATGISVTNPNGGVIGGNRLYANSVAAVSTTGVDVVGNTMYSNGVGIQAYDWGSTGPRSANNLIYDSGTQSVRVNGANQLIENNTFRETSADVLYVNNGAVNTTVRNNVFVLAGPGRAINVTSNSQTNFISNYNLFELSNGGSVALWQGSTYTDLNAWDFELGFDSSSRIADPQFIDIDGPDNLLGYGGGVDGGLDDNFNFASGSPVVDGGDPVSYHYAEPSPNGDRVNIGHLGNTPNATLSPSPMVQVLAPNGREKLTVGTPFNVQFRSAGFTQQRQVLLSNLGGARLGMYETGLNLPDIYTSTFGGPFVTSGVPNAAPAELYRSYIYPTNTSVGGVLSVPVAVPDGTYTLRLHFGDIYGAGSRKFDIAVNGTTTQSNYDISAAAGGALKATTLDIPVTASGGNGILLQLTNKISYAILNGLEILANNASGSPDPRFDLEVSTNGGSTWAPLASNVAVDSLGNGTVPWTPTVAGNQSLVRVIAAGNRSVLDVSDVPFLIADTGNAYYINDGSTTGDLYTTAIGDNANSGKSPSSPMASISSLLARYDLGPGDVIYVDSGDYNLLSNIVITSNDAGVELRGPGGTTIPSNNARNAVLADSPTGYWRLGEGSGTTANSETGAGTGAYLGGVTLGQPGAFANSPLTSASFDGVDDRVALNDPALNVSGNSLTLAAWINPASVSNQQFIIGRAGGTANSTYQYSLYLNGPWLGFRLRNASGQVFDSLTFGYAIPANAWSHVAMTYDGSQVSLFANDQLLQTFTVTGNIASQPGLSTYLGQAFEGTGSQRFSGRIQDVVISSTAFPPGHVTEEYLAGVRTRGLATLNRGNTNNGSYVFELVNADGVKIDGLTITGGYYGIYANSTSDSDGLTLDSLSVTANKQGAIHLENGNDSPTITNNTIAAIQSQSDLTDQDEGIYLTNLANPIVTGNTITNSDSWGIYATAVTNGLFDSNTVGSTGSIGIHVDSASSTVSNNVISGSTGTGIDVSNTVLVSGNTVRDRVTGIVATDGPTVRDNVVSNTQTGLYTRFDTLVANNRLYNNTLALHNFGGSTLIRGNRIYSNTTGLWMDMWGNTSGGYVENNLIYSNTQQAVRLSSPVGLTFTNNTIYEPTANGILVDGGSGTDLKLRSNLFVLAAGRAIEVAADSERGVSSDYNLFNLTGTAVLARWQGVDLTNADAWFYRVGQDGNSLFTDPKFADIDGPDNALGYVGGVDHGADDTFAFQASTPTIDAGDPYGYFLMEPGGGGGRVNIGHLGNSPNALLSADSRTVRLITPNGREKFESGSSQTVAFDTTGLLNQQVVAQIKMGGTGGGSYWLADRFHVGSFNTTSVSTTPVDTSGLIDPPSQDFYSQAETNFSGTSRWLFPVTDGSYSITLHFNEPTYTSANQRKFDIQLNGNTVRSDLDIFAQAGARNRAIALTFNVSATGGNGIDLALVNKLSTSLLYGVEIFRTGLSGAAAKTVSLGISTNAGATYSPLASGLNIDHFGRGIYNWTVSQPLTDDGLIRVSADEPGINPDTGADTFQIVGTGKSYYINNGSTTGDVFTTALGNDRNDGKSPATPMATLSALLSAYDLDAGDTIYVDAGTYTLLQNVLLQLQDAGVRIKGAGQNVTTFDRANTSAERYAFEFNGGNVDGVTIESLGITGGYGGVWSDLNASDNVTLADLKVFGNQQVGVYLNSSTSNATSNDNWIIRDSNFFGVPGGATTDDQTYGVYLNRGNNIIIRDSSLHDHGSTGIYANTVQLTARHNTVFGNQRGLDMSGASITSRAQAIDNDVYSNVQYGIVYGYYVDVTGNRVHGQTGAGHIGIIGSGSSDTITNNVVYGNYRGIDANSAERIAGNRVYFNAEVGIMNHGGVGVIERNQVYSNSIGISTGTAYPDFEGRIQSNLVYANTDRGIEITYGFSSSTPAANVVNNTVYQLVGDAIYISNAPNVRLQNNILYVGNGYGIRVIDSTSQTGFVSDHNIIQRSADPNASVGFWSGARRATLGDWQTATGRDVASISSDPKFVDIDGADNVLGYSTAGTGYDGGKDDNFYLLKNSPAIDHADSSAAAHFDFEGKTRTDDPATPNSGTADYYETVSSNGFTNVGTAKGWRSTNGVWALPLGFTFNYFGVPYTQAYVSSEGFLQFGTNSSGLTSLTPGAQALAGGPRVAVLWDNLSTASTGSDIFVQTTTPNQITIRWAATAEATGNPVNAAVTLFSDGTIRFDYGSGNSGLSPIIGVGSDTNSNPGNGDAYVLSQLSGSGNLANVSSSVFSTASGFRDLGAFEFRGASNDVTPPTITSTLPAQIHTNGSTTTVGQITLNFSEAINRIDGQAVAAYQLVGAGPDNTFGTIDDITYSVTPQYVDGSTQATLVVDSGNLPVGKYRLTVVGNSFTSTGLHDLSGLLFDGDADGLEGGNYVRTFSVVADTTPPTVSDFTFDYISSHHAVKLTFSEPLSAPPPLSAITLANTLTSTTIATSDIAVAWDAATNTLTITFPGLANQRLAKGTYSLNVLASAVTDMALNPMSSNYVKTFGYLPGDSNGDLKVDFNDLLTLAKHYNHVGPYSDGDFNYDGTIDFDDLLILAKAYNQTLAAAPQPGSTAPVGLSTQDLLNLIASLQNSGSTAGAETTSNPPATATAPTGTSMTPPPPVTRTKRRESNASDIVG